VTERGQAEYRPPDVAVPRDFGGGRPVRATPENRVIRAVTSEREEKLSPTQANDGSSQLVGKSLGN
jgi:hypothetical protein